MKLLIASFVGDSAKYFNVTLGSPSRIIKCTMMSDLKTIVHVESLNLFCSARKTSATPASPACVATKICSTYLDLGAASYFQPISWVSKLRLERIAITLIFVAPFTEFSNEPAMAALESGHDLSGPNGAQRRKFV